MKKLLISLPIFTALAIASCSQCYECTSDSTITDGNGNVIGDSSSVTQELCTASADEIKEIEDNGSVCRVQ